MSNSVFQKWIPFALICTIFSGMIYVALQQNIRKSADDIPMQLAIDAAHEMSVGRDSISITQTIKNIDLARSLSPFIFITDENKKPLASSATLHDQLLSPPSGILDASLSKGENHVTWQPESGVRLATVVVPYSGRTSGFIVAGQSLYQSEARTRSLLLQIFLGWIVSLALTFAALWVLEKKA